MTSGSLKTSILGLALATAALLAPHSAGAQTLDWDPGAAHGAGTFGAGTWNTTGAIWSNGTIDTTWTDGDAAVFAGTASGPVSVNLTAARSASSVTFNASGYDLTGSALTLTSAANSVVVAANTSAEIDSLLAFPSSTFSIGAGGVLTLTGGATAGANTNWISSGGGTLDVKSGTYVSAGGGGLTFWAQTNASMEAATMNLAGGRLLIGYAGNSVFTINSASALITQTTTTNTDLVGRAGNTGVLDLKQGTMNLTSSVVLGNDTGSKGTLTVEGGTLNVGAGTSIFVNSAASSATGAGTFNISGGTVTAPTISFGSTGTTFTAGATGTLNVTGGTLYVGTGGIITAGTGLTTAINLSGGTIGATGAWSSTMGMNLTNTNGGVTIQAANASATAENITLGGALTGAGSLTKTGAGTLTLFAGANTYSGGNVINAGTLLQGAAGALGSTSGALTLGGGTLNTNAITTALGVLSVNAASSLDFGATGTGTSVSFANSSGQAWSGLLTVLDYDSSGTIGAAGLDSLFVGTTGAGISNAELADIQFLNPTGLAAGTYSASRGANGEIVVGSIAGAASAPEPGSLVVLFLGGCGMISVGAAFSPEIRHYISLTRSHCRVDAAVAALSNTLLSIRTQQP